MLKVEIKKRLIRGKEGVGVKAHSCSKYETKIKIKERG